MAKRNDVRSNELAKKVEIMSGLLSSSTLSDVLDSLAIACLRYAKNLLNAEKAMDENGNTLRVLLEFNERIGHLTRSASRKNRESRRRDSRAIGMVKMSKEDIERRKAVDRSYDDEEDLD